MSIPPQSLLSSCCLHLTGCSHRRRSPVPCREFVLALVRRDIRVHGPLLDVGESVGVEVEGAQMGE